MSFIGRKIAAFATAVTLTSTGFADLAMGQSTAFETRSTTVRASFHPASNGLSGRYGYVLVDADTQEVLAERNASDTFIPASLSKIPTMLVALHALGEDHRFETKLIADGRIDNGVLYGNLHLVGSGDPSLKTRDLEGLADTLALQGINRVVGKFTFNTDALPRSSVIDHSQPADHSYNPAISGLNVDLNLRRVNGVKKKAAFPGYRTARIFRAAAALRGVSLPAPQHFSGSAPGISMASHYSAPVSEIITAMMKRSTNLTAEALGSLSIAAMTSTPKSLPDAADETVEWLKEQTAGIETADWKGFTLANHSGLSSRSRATPRQIASILRVGYDTYGSAFADYYSEHPSAGYQAYSLRGKSGTMRFVRGYGGFLSIGGRNLIFAIMANDGRQRALADAGVEGLRSRSWMRQARRLEQALLSDWITEYWPGVGSQDAVVVAEASPPAYTVDMKAVGDHIQSVPESGLAQISLATYVRATKPVE